MKNRAKEIDDLFSMFHDFEILGIKLYNETLRMEFLLPWSKMWGIENYKLTFKFEACNKFVCHYFKRIGTELVKHEKGIHYPASEFITKDILEIKQLELDVQSHNFKEPDNFILYCNSSTSFGNKIGQIDFARIELTAKDYKIYDNDNNEISLEKMKEWATEWWNGIQRMWDEQKNEK
jgi:hypothetical protein